MDAKNISKGTFFIISNAKYLSFAISQGKDDLNFKKKRVYPTICLKQRMDIVSSLSFVDKVFIEHSLEDKKLYC